MAPVDEQHLAGDPRGLFGGEKRNCIRDVFRRPDSSQGNLGYEGLLCLWRDVPRLHRPRRDDIHRDAVGAQFRGRTSAV